MKGTMFTDRTLYLSSYCNQVHHLGTGRPVNHECRVIPPKALKAERNGDFALAIQLMDLGLTRRTTKWIK